MLELTASPAFRQYSAGIVSTLSVAAGGSAYLFLEPFTSRMTKGEGVLVTKEQMSWLVAMVEVGGVLSPVPSSYLADRFGRKALNLSIGPLCLLGWILCLFTNSVEVLYLVRIIQGIAVGISFTINPIYTAEVSDPGIRGAIAGIFQVAFYLGGTITYATGPYLSYDTYLLACIPLPLFFTVAFAFFPESPYWLLKRGRDEEAKRALAWLRPNVDIERDFQEMKQAVADDMQGKSKNNTNPWRKLFCDRYERKAFFILQIVCFTKFLTGMPTIVAYASETFAKSDNFLSPSEMTILLGLLLTCIGGLSAFLSDRVGRKTLLLVSCFGTFVAHALTGTYYYLHEKTAVDTSSLVWLMYLGLILYCIFSDIGLGPLLQTLQAEMFGTETRELAGGVTETLAAVLCFLVIKYYQTINDNIGVYFNFWMYGFFGLLGGVLLSILMFETAGKVIGRMEEKDQNLDNKERY